MGSAVSPMQAEDNALSSTNLFIYLVLFTLTLLYVYYRVANKRFFDLASNIPGPPVIPILGNLQLVFNLKNGHDVFKLVYGNSFNYGNVGRFWFGHRLVVFLVGPQEIEQVLSSSSHITKNVEYDMFAPWLGNGLLISNGETWRAHRKIIAPTFHLNVLKSFFDRFNSNSQDLVVKLSSEVGKEFDIHDYMGESTVEILLETVMGVSKTTQTNGFEYAQAVMKMCNILHFRQVYFWLRPDFLYRFTKYGKEQVKLLGIIHSLTKKVLQNKKSKTMKIDDKSMEIQPKATGVPEKENSSDKQNFRETLANSSKESFSYGQATGLTDDLDVEDVGEKKRAPFLDSLLESTQSAGLTDREVEDQVNTIMFEGHDTVAAASSFFLCIMAVRPDIQERCVQELEEIFGNSDRACSFQDTLQMKYLERCIMETLRMFPPVPVIARQILEDLPLESSDMVIPANTTVIIGTFKLHRRPELYPNPDHFDPDNFLPERSASRHYYSFIPFSAGPRSCVGRKYAMLKLKVVLSTVLRNFKIVDGKQMNDWILQGDIILKRTDGFRIKIEHRRKEEHANS